MVLQKLIKQINRKKQRNGSQISLSALTLSVAATWVLMDALRPAVAAYSSADDAMLAIDAAEPEDFEAETLIFVEGSDESVTPPANLVSETLNFELADEAAAVEATEFSAEKAAFAESLDAQAVAAAETTAGGAPTWAADASGGIADDSFSASALMNNQDPPAQLWGNQGNLPVFDPSLFGLEPEEVESVAGEVIAQDDSHAMLVWTPGSTLSEWVSADDFNGNLKVAPSEHGVLELTADEVLSATLGDINGDGIDDVLYAWADAETGHSHAAVVFGGESEVTTLADLNGLNGFLVENLQISGDLNTLVAKIGDFNDDGLQDLLLVQLDADANSAEAHILLQNESGFNAHYDGSLPSEDQLIVQETVFVIHPSSEGDIL